MNIVTHYAITDWLPNHILVVILTLVFAVLNPLLTPFTLIYFSLETGTFLIVITKLVLKEISR